MRRAEVACPRWRRGRNAWRGGVVPSEPWTGAEGPGRRPEGVDPGGSAETGRVRGRGRDREVRGASRAEGHLVSRRLVEASRTAPASPLWGLRCRQSERSAGAPSPGSARLFLRASADGRIAGVTPVPAKMDDDRAGEERPRREDRWCRRCGSGPRLPGSLSRVSRGTSAGAAAAADSGS